MSNEKHDSYLVATLWAHASAPRASQHTRKKMLNLWYVFALNQLVPGPISAKTNDMNFRPALRKVDSDSLVDDASNPIDQKYYEAVRAGSLGERLAIRARDNIYDDFLRFCSPGKNTTVLDVGVCDVRHRAANVVERRYPYPLNLTAAGLGVGDAFREIFPALHYQQIASGKPLPFADKQFDVVTSNAVLEHVSSRGKQMHFVNELTRVARQIFISVPNRFFPVEHHTALPLLHYNDALFRWACRTFGRDDWADETHLILMSKRELIELAPAGSRMSVGYTGLKLGPLSSNLFLYLDTRLR